MTYRKTWPHEYVLSRKDGQQALFEAVCARFRAGEGVEARFDRSIALVDLALRRRFHFVDFYPDEPPVEGLLRRWLQHNAPDMQWVADVVDEANRRLGDRHAAVGPSYFMQKGLDEQKVRLIWNYAVLPYVSERLFGETDRLREFELEALRRSADAGGGAPDPADDDTDEQDGGDAAD